MTLKSKSSAPRPRIFLAEDLVAHQSSGDCWVSRHGKVYDLTSFLADHPGGEDLILKYAGRDLADSLGDAAQHVHSESAYRLLDDLQIGVLGHPETILDPTLVISDDFAPKNTDSSSDYARNGFLDLSQPLIPQMWNCNFSKKFYLQQVHQPRHLPLPARLFGPWYLEMFTRTSWYVVPLVWLPITWALFSRALQQHVDRGSSLGQSWVKNVLSFLLGNLIWTLLEYFLHRFLFHIDDFLPDQPIFLLLHFLLHGVHHYLPMDRLRLVMPPLLFALLSFPFTQLGHFLFPAPYANGIISGAFAFYVLYDCTHYALHHTHLPKRVKDMKIYHMAHHFKNADLGFGVTSKIWDHAFGTVLPIE